MSFPHPSESNTPWDFPPTYRYVNETILEGWVKKKKNVENNEHELELGKVESSPCLLTNKL